MARCKIDYKINNEHFNSLGIYKDNKLTFMENDIKFILSFSNDTLEILRENNEFKLKLILGKNSTCTYELKNTNVGILSINVINKSLEIKDGIIKALYKLDDAIFDLNLTYEVI